MIFVTVGAQMPFDRLVHALDAWAATHRDVAVFAQVGDTPAPPAHIPYSRMLTPAEFAERVRGAQLIVAHAGMGSILTALEYGKPLLVMPRRADLRETRNDHQLATVKQFADNARIHVAPDEHALATQLDALLSQAPAPGMGPQIGAFASPALLSAIRDFILENRLPQAAGAPASAKPGVSA